MVTTSKYTYNAKCYFLVNTYLYEKNNGNFTVCTWLYTYIWNWTPEIKASKLISNALDST